jgi:hypothetical protein
MKTSITLKLDTGVIRKAKVIAAKEGTSVSALLADKLERVVRDRTSYDLARKRALARLRKGFDLRWTPPASRDQLHER